MPIRTQAAIENDLYHVPENVKAEIVNGELRFMSPTGAFTQQRCQRDFCHPPGPCAKDGWPSLSG
jgi:hypothetical protein